MLEGFFKPAPFRPGTEDYDLWLWKEEYAKGGISLEELEYRIEWILKHPPGPPEPDLITIEKEWK